MAWQMGAMRRSSMRRWGRGTGRIIGKDRHPTVSLLSTTQQEGRRKSSKGRKSRKGGKGVEEGRERQK